MATRKNLVFGLVITILVALVVALIAQNLSLTQTHKKDDSINLGASAVHFTPLELQTWLGIKDRLSVYNFDPDFTGNRTLQWISMRNSSSGDYYQKSMEFLCFWSGQGANGEWEAVISIYNLPDNKSDFVVEVSRFTWHELHVLLDGNIMVDFPQVTNDTTSPGYATFHVSVS